MIALALAQDVIPFVGDQTPVTGRALLVSLAVVALVSLVAWVLRTNLPRSRGRQDFAVERALALGERRTLVIVSVENRRLLLGMSPQHIGLITELQPVDRGSFDQALEQRIAAESAS